MFGANSIRNVRKPRWDCSVTVYVLLAAGFSLTLAQPAAAQVLLAEFSEQAIPAGAAIIDHVFTANGGTEPYLWSNLVLISGSPAVAPTLEADGSFQWHTVGSPRPGQYRWEATVTDSAVTQMSAIGSLTIQLIVPEPSAATLLLLGAALTGCRFTRRRN